MEASECQEMVDPVGRRRRVTNLSTMHYVYQRRFALSSAFYDFSHYL
jgi:hypothetical protein